MRWLLPIGIVTGLAFAACGDGNGNPEAELRDDVDRIVQASNDQDWGRLYDEFMTEECREETSREEWIEESSGAQVYPKIEDFELETLKIEGDTATFDLTLSTTVQGVALEPETTRVTFVREAGHWRDTNCFMGEEVQPGTFPTEPVATAPAPMEPN